MSRAASALPGDATLGPVSLRVANLTRARLWLERVLGLVVQPGSAVRSTVLGTRAGVPLVVLREVAGARRVPQAGLLGLYHYAIRLPSRGDLARFVRHLEELGEAYAGSDHAFSEAVYLTDPDGITVEVYADRPRETWKYHGDDVVGTIEPLDRAGLIREAGGAPWNGAPPLTDMGHLHFFTGNLVAAERFYVSGLGFGVSTRLLPGTLFVSAGGYHHHVGLNVWAAANPVAGPGDAGLDEWSLQLPNPEQLERLAARLSQAGVASRLDGAALATEDPWGIRVRASVV